MKRPRMPNWLPHFGRAGRWLLATVLAAVIGVVVTGALSADGDEGDEVAATATATATVVPFPRSRQVESQRVGLYLVEEDGSSDGALQAFGPDSSRERSGPACTLTWEDVGVKMTFANFGAADPCSFGKFCRAHITGSGWATTKGLEVGESVRRMLELYPDAERIEETGAIIRYVLEPGIAPCGENAEGGLEAWTGSGRVGALRVTFAAAGD